MKYPTTSRKLRNTCSVTEVEEQAEKEVEDGVAVRFVVLVVGRVGVNVIIK